MVDYYLRTSRKLLDATRAKLTLPDTASTPLIVWPAIIACVMGIFFGLAIEWGIPSLNSLLVASVIYMFTVRLVQITNDKKENF